MPIFLTTPTEESNDCRRPGQFRRRARVGSCWARWCWSCGKRTGRPTDSGDLATDPSLLLPKACVIDLNGIDVEVIYAELVDVPVLSATPSLFVAGWRCRGRFCEIQAGSRKASEWPANLTFYGFDLSQPLPTYHSVIRQPCRALAHRLSSGINQYGLIEDREAAATCLAQRMRCRYIDQFVWIGVWGIGK